MYYCWFSLPLQSQKPQKPLLMTKKKQFDELQRLVHLISDDNELLNRANTFMQNLVDSKLAVRGKQDISTQLAERNRQIGSGEKHQ